MQKTSTRGNVDSSCLSLLSTQYPNARKSLLDQLDQSVHARGVYLQYLQSHNQEFAYRKETKNKARSVKPSPSLISTGSTVKHTESDNLPYPPMPKGGTRAGLVACTICFEPMNISEFTEEKWKYVQRPITCNRETDLAEGSMLIET